MNVEQMGFGYVDDQDESLKGKSIDGVFGLNQGVKLVHFAFNANAGKDESEANAIDMTFKIGESEQRRRIYEITKVYNGNEGEVTDKSSDLYKKLYNEQWMQDSAMITHLLKAFVTEDTIKQALATPASSFKDWATIVTGLVPNGFENHDLDLFMEYQWTIPEGKDQTYLQIPKNMKGGYWVCKAQLGTFAPTTKEDGSLVYLNEQGNEHPFTRNKNFMEGNKAKRQSVNDALDNASAGTPAKSGNW